MIDFIDSKDQPDANLDLVRVFTASDATEAHLICGRLNEEGVQANVVGDYNGTGYPLQNTCEILVPKSQAKASTEFLRAWQDEIRPVATQPFSIWTTAAFLFVSVAVLAFVGAVGPDQFWWIPYAGAGAIGLPTLWWISRRMDQESAK